MRDVLFAGVLTTALALGAVATADDASKPTGKPTEPPASCAPHAQAMHGMKTKEEREAYCRAHAGCMSHNCGGVGTHGHGQDAGPPGKSKAK